MTATLASDITVARDRRGRKSEINWELAAELRRRYWTYSKIAKFMGVHYTCISKGLKKRGVR